MLTATKDFEHRNAEFTTYLYESDVYQDVRIIMDGKLIFKIKHGIIFLKYYQLSHGYQGDTEKYLTRGNLYHPRHTCITRDVVEGNTGVSRVIQVFDFITPKKYRHMQNFMETGMKPNF